MSFGKQFAFAPLQHPVTFRVQANIFNIFNKTNLLPLSFGSSGDKYQQSSVWSVAGGRQRTGD